MFVANRLTRLGNQECSLAPESIDDTLLDELSKLILGESNSFKEMVRQRRIVPQLFNPSQSVY